MQRRSKAPEKMGHTERCVPLSDDLDMVRLKKLVSDLPPERRSALKKFLSGMSRNKEA